MKPDQERVKNLLLDTVTLLCKNSLQYENKLRVEGLLGVSVDESDVFFLHISENFQNSTAVDTNNVSGKESEVVTDSNRESSHDREDVSSQIQDSRDSVSEQIRVKSEIHDVGSDSDDLIITSSSLNSPHTVAQPATVVAGQRRSPHKRTHSPSFRDSIHNSSQISQNSQRDSLNSTNQMTSLDGDYTYSECGDGTSFDQLQSQHMIKQETGWDQEPAAKRHMSDSSPWPNLAGLSDLAAQAAQASQDGDDGGGGSYSQPGCSSWPSASTPLLPNSGVQDTKYEDGDSLSGGQTGVVEDTTPGHTDRQHLTTPHSSQGRIIGECVTVCIPGHKSPSAAALAHAGWEGVPAGRRNVVTLDTKQKVIEEILAEGGNSKNGSVPWGRLTVVARRHGLCKATVSNVWKSYWKYRTLKRDPRYFGPVMPGPEEGKKDEEPKKDD